jgi:hypothetical protein
VPGEQNRPAQPEVDEPKPGELDEIIPAEFRTRNPNVQCVWVAASEVLAGAGYSEFQGWGEVGHREGFRGSEMGYVLKALDERNIPYKSQRNNRNTDIFDFAHKEGVGVYVQIPGHALVVVRLTHRYAYVINNYSNVEASKKIQRWTRDEFIRRWEGAAFCPLKRKRPRPQQIVQPPPQTVPAVQPGPLNPTPPVVHPAPPPAEKPAPKECQCKPVELGPVNEALVKLTEIAAATSKSVADLGGKVGTLDARIAVVEGKLADAATLPPPSATVSPEQLKAVQDELTRLRNSLKQSGTLKVTVLPK